MKTRSDILDMALDFANDLHAVGAMDKATLRDIEELAIPKVPEYSPMQIRGIREQNCVSQPIFASYMNVGRTTVAQWEQGKKKPTGSAARLIDLVARKGIRAIA